MRDYSMNRLVSVFRNVGALLILSGVLTGCMFLEKPVGIPVIRSSKPRVCAKAPVLLTNLNVPLSQRHYLLPNGQACGIRVSHLNWVIAHETERTKNTTEMEK